MIYTRWGYKVEIVANNGLHMAPGFVVEGNLVRVKFLGRRPDKFHYYFAEPLRSDGGLLEIIEAVDKALEIDPIDIKQAIQEAL